MEKIALLITGKKYMFVGIALFILITTTILVFLSRRNTAKDILAEKPQVKIGQNNQTDTVITPIDINSNTTIEKDEQEITNPQIQSVLTEYKAHKKVMMKGLDSDNKEWQILLVGDTNDPDWITYKPENIQTKIDLNKNTATVSWDDPETELKPYYWVIGYWSKEFDPVEKWQTEKLAPEDQILWWGIRDTYPEAKKKHKSITFTLAKFPAPTNLLFSFFYKRFTFLDGRAVDYLYGDNDTSSVPFKTAILQ